MGKGWGDPGCSGVATEGGADKAPTGPLMRFTKARNDKPLGGEARGLTRLGGSHTLSRLQSVAEG
jgi:hypothetical protein